MRYAIVRSEALQGGRRALQAGPYAHPTFAIDRAIERTQRTLAQAQVRLVDQLVLRERLLEENRGLCAPQDDED